MSEQDIQRLTIEELKDLSVEDLISSSLTETEKWISIIKPAIKNDNNLVIAKFATLCHDIVYPLMLHLFKRPQSTQGTRELILCMIESLVRQRIPLGPTEQIRDLSLAMLAPIEQKNQDLALRVLPYVGPISTEQRKFIGSTIGDSKLQKRVNRCLQKLEQFAATKKRLTDDTKPGTVVAEVRESRTHYQTDSAGASDSNFVLHESMPDENGEEPPALALPHSITTRGEAIAVIQQTHQYLSQLAIHETLSSIKLDSSDSERTSVSVLKELAGDEASSVKFLRSLLVQNVRNQAKIRRTALSEVNQLLKVLWGKKLRFTDAKKLFDELRKYAVAMGANIVYEGKPVRVSIVEGKNKMAIARIKEIGSTAKNRLDTGRNGFPEIKIL